MLYIHISGYKKSAVIISHNNNEYLFCINCMQKILETLQYNIHIPIYFVNLSWKYYGFGNLYLLFI